MYKISCITWSVRFDKWGGNAHSTAGESNNKKYKKMAYNLTKSIKRQLQIRVISNFDRTRPLVIGAISRVFLAVVALIIGFITSWPLHSNSCVCDVVTFRHSDIQTLGNSAFQCCERTWPISRRWSCLVMPQTTNFVASMSDHHQCYLLVCLSGNIASIAYPYQASIHHHRFNDERIAMWFHCPSDRPSIWIVLLRLCKAIIIILSGNCNFYNFVGSVCQLFFFSSSDRPQFGTIWTQI